MNLSNKSVLINGGGSGIGLEIARQFNAKGNKVIVVGRNNDKLQNAVKGLEHVKAFSIDITDEGDVKKLVNLVSAEFGDLGIVVNNAAASPNGYNHGVGANAFAMASDEMLTNYLSVIRLNEQLLPLLQTQPEAAIVNVSSIVAFSPNAFIPTYSDSKAALHSYTLSLRHELAKKTNVRVFELMPPLVNTEFSKLIGGDINGMPAIDVAVALINALENNEFEIHVGQTKNFRGAFLANPAEAFTMLNPN